MLHVRLCVLYDMHARYMHAYEGGVIFYISHARYCTYMYVHCNPHVYDEGRVTVLPGWPHGSGRVDAAV